MSVTKSNVVVNTIKGKRIDILDMPTDKYGSLGMSLRRELVKIHNYVRDYPEKNTVFIATLSKVLESAKANALPEPKAEVKVPSFKSKKK